MNIPENLLYSSDHEWVRLDDGKAVIGITDYAQDALGDVVFVDLPDIGGVVSSGQSITEVESTKSVSDIYAPIPGTIIEVNHDLVESPELLNEDPYGDGWICTIQSSGDSMPDLLSPEQYGELIAS
ncbi:MAG: glycine cleavage system protein H [Actinobacteria bacterium]|nr:glycine cleavage system protein H [Actinomycetota bacterium]|tara:strand:+ start:11325 stop:11702 length:378 start_codon:yes stop_codon:yes gene_type:complete